MRLMPALERLLGELGLAAEHGFSAGPEKIRAWHGLATELAAAAKDEWLAEPAFRLRTGASAKWCRRHFSASVASGTARQRDGHREWHVSARPPRPHPSDPEGLVREIVQSFEKAS